MLVKYPRTYHFPWSPGLQNDDRRLSTLDGLIGKRVIVTEKMDGENTTMLPNHIHARSLDSRHHPSRTWVKMFWGEIKHNIPDDMRICGENMFAKHSIWYDDLPSYFLGFSAWTGNVCHDWDFTVFVFEELGITPVPIWYDGMYNEDVLHELWESKDPDKVEGYVVRDADPIPMDLFNVRVGKFVREKHVQTDDFWMNQPIIQNNMRKNK